MRSKRLVILGFLVVCAGAGALTDAAQTTSISAARERSEKLWGPSGGIRQEQVGPSTSWIYESGARTQYGFEVRGRGTGDWSNAFDALPAPKYRQPLTDRIVIDIGRIRIGRNPDTAARDVFGRASENSKTRAEAEERLAKFVDAVCSVAQYACDAAGAQFRVAVMKGSAVSQRGTQKDPF